jgi:hypothetical protein
MTDFNQKVLVDKAYVIPQAGIETIPIATLASVDVNGSGLDAGGVLEMTAESTIGGVLVYSAYQAILTLLKSEASRKAGDITRMQQLKLVVSTAVHAGRSSAFTMVVASAIVALMPWLAGPLTILGVVGGGVMASRIAHQFWMALDESQQQDLRKAAEAAKVKIDGLIPDDTTVAMPAAMPA